MNELTIPKKPKDNYWQIIRGLCILAVIMIHCPTGVSYGIDGFEFKVWLTVRQFINFAVPIFFFMAGYFVNAKKCINNTKLFFLDRGRRLLVPFFVWSAFYTSVYTMTHIWKYGIVNWWHLIFIFLTGKSAPQLYFVLVLIQLSLLTPYLLKIINRNTFISRILWLITPCYLLFVYTYVIKIGKLPPLYATLFPAWFIFYYLGLQTKMEKIKPLITLLNKKSLLVFSLVASAFEAFLLINYTGNVSFSCSALHFCNLILVFVLIAIFNLHKNMKIKIRLLEGIGNFSYGIFYIHWLFITLVRACLNRTGLSQFYLLYFSVIFITTLILSFLFVKYSKKFMGKTDFGNAFLHMIGFA